MESLYMPKPNQSYMSRRRHQSQHSHAEKPSNHNLLFPKLNNSKPSLLQKNAFLKEENMNSKFENYKRNIFYRTKQIVNPQNDQDSPEIKPKVKFLKVNTNEISLQNIINQQNLMTLSPQFKQFNGTDSPYNDNQNPNPELESVNMMTPLQTKRQTNNITFITSQTPMALRQRPMLLEKPKVPQKQQQLEKRNFRPKIENGIISEECMDEIYDLTKQIHETKSELQYCKKEVSNLKFDQNSIIELYTKKAENFNKKIKQNISQLDTAVYNENIRQTKEYEKYQKMCENIQDLNHEIDDERMIQFKKVINIQNDLGIGTGPIMFDEVISLSGNHNDLATYLGFQPDLQSDQDSQAFEDIILDKNDFEK